MHFDKPVRMRGKLVLISTNSDPGDLPQPRDRSSVWPSDMSSVRPTGEFQNRVGYFPPHQDPMLRVTAKSFALTWLRLYMASRQQAHVAPPEEQ
jgi:hypothetical protein